MPKMKSRKAVASRFKVTGRGALMRRGSGKRHLLAKKSAKHKMRLRREERVENRQKRTYKWLMGV